MYLFSANTDDASRYRLFPQVVVEPYRDRADEKFLPHLDVKRRARSATREEAREVAGKNLDLYLCANRTCEVGMEHATRAPYESCRYSLEKLTRT